MKNENKTKGLNFLILIPVGFVLMVISVIVFYEGRKAYWDYQVDKMCEKDGGVHVYIEQKLPLAYVSDSGLVKIPFEVKSTIDDLYFIRIVKNKILEGYLSVGSYKTQIIRRKDDIIIAEVISYGRGGGDFLSFAHPSYKSCNTDLNTIELMYQEAFEY